MILAYYNHKGVMIMIKRILTILIILGFMFFAENVQTTPINSTSFKTNSAPVSEPPSMLLFGAGLIGLSSVSRRNLK